MTDRRRINGPPGESAPPIFACALTGHDTLRRPSRTRSPEQPRKIFLRTGITPSASGSAYLELEQPLPTSNPDSLIPQTSSLKISCTVHGPRPLPRSAPFSPQLVLSTNVKFAPFASRIRREYIRDVNERDLGAHLEAALRAVVIGDRWPKSGVEVIVTVLEGEEDEWWVDNFKSEEASASGVAGCGMMAILSGCITVASAAIIDAGIDCVDVVSGGVAALVHDPGTERVEAGGSTLVVDPCPAEHQHIIAACVVGYLATRDEVVDLWMRGDASAAPESLVEGSISAAKAARSVLTEAIKESSLARFPASSDVLEEKRLVQESAVPTKDKGKIRDVEMTG